MKNSSARSLWGDYLDRHLEYAFNAEPSVKCIGENKEASEKLIRRIMAGKKRAHSRALLSLQLKGEPLPKIGDFTVLTDWEGNAKCILRTVAVRLKPFFSIHEDYAKLDLDDDENHVDTWKKIHWQLFTDALEPFHRVPRESMIVVCEVFEKVYQR